MMRVLAERDDHAAVGYAGGQREGVEDCATPGCNIERQQRQRERHTVFPGLPFAAARPHHTRCICGIRRQQGRLDFPTVSKRLHLIDVISYHHKRVPRGDEQAGRLHRGAH